MNKYHFFTCLFASILLLQACGPQGKELVWSDEFDYEGAPDADKWTVYVGDGCPDLCGFGNQELQYYSDRLENVIVKDGHLIITALGDSLETRAYSSAKLVTKSNWKYGRLEISAKLPEGRGTWPAIWMLPAKNKYGGWPRSGEIDIMEHVGYDQGNVHGTVHTESFNHMKGTQKGNQIAVADASDAFHVYAIEWHADRIDFFVDETKYHSFENTGLNSDDWPFDHPFYLILNIAVGGTWGGKNGVNESIWPQQMEIDYVRVFTLPK